MKNEAVMMLTFKFFEKKNIDHNNAYHRIIVHLFITMR